MNCMHTNGFKFSKWLKNSIWLKGWIDEGNADELLTMLL